MAKVRWIASQSFLCGQTYSHAANCKSCGGKTPAMAVEAVTAHSCATNRSIGAVPGWTRSQPVRQLGVGRSWPLARQRHHRHTVQNTSRCHAIFSLASLEFGRRRQRCCCTSARAALAGPGARAGSLSALQHKDRAGVCPLGAGLCPVLANAPSTADGC